MLPERLWELGKADIYEVCRLSNFHTLIFQDRKHGHDSNVPKNAPLWEAIQITVESSQKTGGNNAKQKKDKLMDRVIEHCVEMEFLNYWNLLSQEEKDELAKEGITNYKQNYRTQMAKAQTAYHNIFTSGEFACFVLVVLSLLFCPCCHLHRSYSIAIRTPPAISPSPVAIPTPFRNP